MLCRLGFSEERRPVRATIWVNMAWMRPSGSTASMSGAAVGAAQLLDLAVAQDQRDDRVLVLDRLEARGVGRVDPT